MVSLVGCVVQCREDIFRLKRWVFRLDFLVGGSSPQQLEHICDSDPLSANAWASSARGDERRLLTWRKSERRELGSRTPKRTLLV